MTGRIEPPHSTPPSKPEPNRIKIASNQFTLSMEKFRESIYHLLQSPHLSDSPQALQQIAQNIQELDQTSHAAINTEDI